MDSEITRSTGVYDFLGWLDTNRQKVLMWLGVGAVAVLIISFVVWRGRQNELKASEALSELQDPVRMMGDSDNEPAAQAYLDLVSEHSGTRAAARARLLGAARLFEEGKFAESQAQFEEYLRDHGDNPLRVQAQLGVAACLEAQGKNAEAINYYQTLISRNPMSFALPQARFDLALLQEKEGHVEEAFKLYQELSRLQTSSYAGQSHLRLQALVLKNPSLLGTNAPAGTTAAPGA